MERKQAGHQFRISDVIVKPGTVDPDFLTDLSGWVGVIQRMVFKHPQEVLYQIRWSEKTLKRYACSLKQACQEMGLDVTSMYLLESEIDLYTAGRGAGLPAKLIPGKKWILL
ncbi:hypothetical protein [Photobacterium sp. TY1-4]|uniref:hypothetical protein n=1 Tax=Photobacterium sp. TY1-4 TaxID=2899122 RepID=UPI0021C0E5B9|nr:hypothetical protein [Photobacterium sp. TY1-4]UXI03220.1 hypothetical protein NH461_22560 [Photobacterium sp. TY1-4]